MSNISQNKSRISDALGYLRTGLVPYVGEIMIRNDVRGWPENFIPPEDRSSIVQSVDDAERFLDVAAAFNAITSSWQVFKRINFAGPFKELASLIREVRHTWAHNSPVNDLWFTCTNTAHALQNILWLLRSTYCYVEASKVELILNDPDFSAAVRKELQYLAVHKLPEMVEQENLVHLLAELVPPISVTLAHRIWELECLPILDSEVILDFINGQQGVGPSQFITRYNPSMELVYPSYITKKQREDPADRVKAFVQEYVKGVLDQDNFYRFTVGPTNYHWTLDVRDSARQLQRQAEIAGNPIDILLSFPGALYTDCAVISADNKIILGLRSKALHSYPGMWCLTCEGAEPEIDRDDNGRFHPAATALRGAHEELNISYDYLNSGYVTFLALAFALDYGTHDLKCVIRLRQPVTSQQLLTNASPWMRTEGEIQRFEAVDFTLRNCMELIVRPEHEGIDGQPHPVTPPARATLLALALHEFGYTSVLEELKRFPPQWPDRGDAADHA